MAELLGSYDRTRSTEVQFSYSSYRDSYDHLTAHLCPNFFGGTVGELVDGLTKKVIGRTFPGYKGGEYFMNSDTPVWLAEYGRHGIRMTAEILRAMIEAVPLQ